MLLKLMKRRGKESKRRDTGNKKMKKTYFILIKDVILVCVLAALIFYYRNISTIETGTPGYQRPVDDCNIILITINCLRADHVNCYGYYRKTTPAIDKLARESCVFENTYTQAGYTFASMMSLMNSLYPASHGVFYPLKDKLSPDIQTIAEILNIHGYTTAWFSKLSFPHLDVKAGFGRGFNYLGNLEPQELNGREKIFLWIEENKDNKFFLAIDALHVHAPYVPLFWHKDKFLKGKKDKNIDSHKEYEKIRYSVLLELANSRPGNSFYGIISQESILANKELFNGEYAFDKPIEIERLIPKEKKDEIDGIIMGMYFSRLKREDGNNVDYLKSLYDTCILDIDQMLIKALISELKALKIYDKTLLVITAEHGEAFGEHGYSGHGFQLHDELIHVPLIIKIPYTKRYRRIKTLVQNIDIMPTVLEITGIKVPHYVQGKSLLPLIREKKNKALHKYIYGQSPEAQYIRSEEWKLIKKKLTRGKLYHLTEDPQELRDVSYFYPEVYTKLNYIMEEHAKSLPDYKVASDFRPYIDEETQERIKKTGYW